jgi:hypothetical protein
VTELLLVAMTAFQKVEMKALLLVVEWAEPLAEHLEPKTAGLSAASTVGTLDVE